MITFGTENLFSGSVSPTTEPIVTTEADISVVGREETHLILKSFTSNPIKWWKVLIYMKKYSRLLSNAVRDFCRSSTKRELKQQIKGLFKEVICADPEELQDLDIRYIFAFLEMFHVKLHFFLFLL